jgi:hypothetical protein
MFSSGKTLLAAGMTSWCHLMPGLLQTLNAAGAASG